MKVNSKIWMDRLSIACHRDTPAEYLTKLTEDEDLRVREVAQIELEKRRK